MGISGHAKAAGDNGWGSLTYWICSFSNNQWNISDDIPAGDVYQSSFYLALTSGTCVATVMILDEEMQPLARSWCLFEILQSLRLKQVRPDFEGLLYSTSTGVLNYAAGSYDTALTLAEKLVTLKLEDAQAGQNSDKEMIDEEVQKLPGGFEQVNLFVRSNMKQAMHSMKGRFLGKFKMLEVALSPDPHSCYSI